MFILNKYIYSANKQMDDRTRIPRFVFFIEISRFFFFYILVRTHVALLYNAMKLHRITDNDSQNLRRANIRICKLRSPRL